MHWMRDAVAPSIEPASERASIVLAVPGTSSKRTWPPARERREDELDALASCRGRPSRRSRAAAPPSRSPARSARSAPSPSRRSAQSSMPDSPRGCSVTHTGSCTCGRKHRSLAEPVGDELGQSRPSAGARRRPRAAGRRHRRARVDPGPERACQRTRARTASTARGSARRTTARKRRRRETVAQPKSGDRAPGASSGRRPSRRRARRRLPSPRSRVAGGRSPSVIALSRMQRSTTGTKSVPSAYAIGVSTPPKSPGQTSVLRAGSGPTSFRCVPTGRSQTRSCVSRSQAMTRPALPAPKTIGRDLVADRGEDRRDVEVVVADVVGEHLVVPERACRSPRRARRASRCRACCRGTSRRSGTLGEPPHGPGFEMPT